MQMQQRRLQRIQAGDPSSVVGTMVHAVKSVATPIISVGSTPAALIASGTAIRSTSM
jgi:hypothetical protein